VSTSTLCIVNENRRDVRALVIQRAAKQECAITRHADAESAVANITIVVALGVCSCMYE